MNSDFLILLPVLLFSVVVHEVAHAWVALREGDDTAQNLGRITLNPVSHLDVVGSVVVPLLLYYTTGVVFGWAKPVPIDPRKFRTPRASDIKVSLAGIASNILLAVGFTVLYVALGKLQVVLDGSVVVGVVLRMCFFGVFINLLLALFNLLPIPPLDGSHVMFHMLPEGMRLRYRKLGGYGILVLVGIMILAPSLFSVVFQPVFVIMNWWNTLMYLWI
ncbi:MAG: site-2 protease family protein [Gemmatimonadota bacterium]|nr:MAG: site-2 protease family protein [Gemmatimonadota bacterium]